MTLDDQRPAPGPCASLPDRQQPRRPLHLLQRRRHPTQRHRQPAHRARRLDQHGLRAAGHRGRPRQDPRRSCSTPASWCRRRRGPRPSRSRRRRSRSASAPPPRSRPLSLANAYATLMNEGVHVPPRFFTEVRTGGVGHRPRPGGREGAGRGPRASGCCPRASPRTWSRRCRAVTSPSGTAPRARQPFPVYGKTGTTNDGHRRLVRRLRLRPRQDICVAVWMGYEDQGCTGRRQDGACGGMQDVHGVGRCTAAPCRPRSSPAPSTTCARSRRPAGRQRGDDRRAARPERDGRPRPAPRDQTPAPAPAAHRPQPGRIPDPEPARRTALPRART